jgi:hypothetical protein
VKIFRRVSFALIAGFLFVAWMVLWFDVSVAREQVVPIAVPAFIAAVACLLGWQFFFLKSEPGLTRAGLILLLLTLIVAFVAGARWSSGLRM